MALPANFTQDDLLFHMALDVTSDPIAADVADSSSSSIEDQNAKILKDLDAHIEDIKQRETNKAAPGSKFDPTKEVLIFVAEGRAYVANPMKCGNRAMDAENVTSIEGIGSGPTYMKNDLANFLESDVNTTGFKYRRLSLQQYNLLVSSNRIKPDTTDTYTWAHAVALGDFTWYAAGELVTAYGTESNVDLMGWLFPPLLGIFVAWRCYQNEIDRFIKDNGREPTEAERQIIYSDSVAVGFKMTAAVFGWTVGAEFIAPALLELFGKSAANAAAFTLGTSTGGAANLIFALATGAGAAIFISLAALTAAAMQKGEITREDLKNVAGLAVCAFIGGTAWSLMAFLPITFGATGEGSRLLEQCISAVAVYLGVKLAFSLYDTEKSSHTFWNKPSVMFSRGKTMKEELAETNQQNNSDHKFVKELPTLTPSFSK